jgi:hypothetical protein
MARLQARGVIAEPVTAVAADNAFCAIESPVRLRSLTVAGGRTVLLSDNPTVSCAFAERFTDWLAELAAPLVAAALPPLKAVRTGTGYVCRNRNHQAQGRLSAHAVGLAMDVAGFELGDGSTLTVVEARDSARMQVLSTMRTAACGWFTTILGPGSDAAHATHWHFDIMKHGQNGTYKICE